MRWSEIEQSVSNTEGFPPIDPRQVEAQKQIEVDELFNRFKVRECLEAVGNDVWGEGVIKQNGGIFSNIYCKETIGLNNQLALVSNPIPEIQISTPDKPYKPMLIVVSTGCSLNVAVYPSSQYDRGTLETRAWSIYNFDEQTPDLQDALKRYSLTTALENSELFNKKLKGKYFFTKQIIVDNPQAEGEFHQGLVDLVTLTIKNNSLPKQVRVWCEDRVNQLPKDWPRGKWIGFDQLLEYAYQVRGTSDISKKLHRLTDYRFV